MKLKILCWFSRILAIIAILFMMMFSLDEFGGNNTLARQILGFLMHNIPAFICILALIISWKYEIAGGIIFILFFITAGIFFKSFSGNPGSLIVITPLAVSGVLFIIHGILSPRKNVPV